VEQARAEYQSALVAHPDDVATLRGAAALALASGQAHEAEAALRAIIGLKTKARDDAAWARRQLAILLESLGDHRR